MAAASSLHYLFFAIDGDGSNPPFIAVAQQLQAAGHRISFAGLDSQQKMAEGNGFTFVPLPGSSKTQALYFDDFLTVNVLAMLVSEDHLTEVPAILADVRPDRVVIDCMMCAGLAALQAEQAKGSAVPPVTLIFSSTTSGICTLETITMSYVNFTRQQAGLQPLEVFNDATLLTLINKARGQCGLSPISTFFDMWASILQQLPGSRALIASIPELETAEYTEKVRGMPEGSYVYIGAQIPRADRPIHIKASLNAASKATTASAWGQSLPFDITPTNQSTPLILASFTTGRSWTQATRINRVGEALGGTQERPYHLIVTYAAQQLDQLHVPSNVGLTSYIPHSVVLPLSSACVTHCGHGTATAALSHGVPVIGLPNMGDQPLLSSRAQELGAGIALDGENATPDDIRAAVNRVLDEPSFKQKAMELKAKYDALKAIHTPLVV